MRFVRLWAVLVAVYLVAALLVIFIATAIALERDGDVAVPMFLSVSMNDGAPMWEISGSGLGIVILVLPALTAAIVAVLSRGDRRSRSDRNGGGEP